MMLVKFDFIWFNENIYFLKQKAFIDVVLLRNIHFLSNGKENKAFRFNRKFNERVTKKLWSNAINK